MGDKTKGSFWDLLNPKYATSPTLSGGGQESLDEKVKKKCEHAGCSMQPHFNCEGEWGGRFCAQHKLDGVVNVKNKRCEQDGCSTPHPQFNFVGEGRGKFCAQHKLEGMVDVKIMWQYEKAGCSMRQYKGCEQAGCSKLQKRGRFCMQHKEQGMVNVISKRCKHDACANQPSFNFVGEGSGRFCGRHKLQGMVDVANKRCEQAGCSMWPAFNFEGKKRGGFCARHKLQGMVDVTITSCGDEINDEKKDVTSKPHVAGAEDALPDPKKNGNTTIGQASTSQKSPSPQNAGHQLGRPSSGQNSIDRMFKYVGMEVLAKKRVVKLKEISEQYLYYRNKDLDRAGLIPERKIGRLNEKVRSELQWHFGNDVRITRRSQNHLDGYWVYASTLSHEDLFANLFDAEKHIEYLLLKKKKAEQNIEHLLLEEQKHLLKEK